LRARRSWLLSKWQVAARELPVRATLIEDLLAIDEDMLDAGRISGRIVPRRVVLNFRGIEDGEICPGLCAYHAAVQ
jgi:hypothetical protein